ncbi:unnamed protein product [Rotaria sp. Silwood2]|nr:unnamed protein product [Rotaria sp. Silwood2]
MMSLELYKRYEIVFLRKNKYGPKFGINRIAKLVNCNRSTVVRWLKRWEETKDLSDRERKGRPRKTTTTDDEIVIGLVRQGVDEGLTSEKIEHHQKKRLTWARSLMNYDWNQVMATDESVFRLHDIKRFYWQRPGERKICRKVKYTIKINAWCCLSAVGFGRIVCFKNNLNSTFLCNNIYHDGLLPAAREHFGRSRNWVLLEDNDPKHRSKVSVKWKEDHHVKTLPWPSLSPDMNPVENLWSLLKIKVAEQRPTTVKELIRAIEKEWNDLPQELASNLIDSMKRRVDSLIEANGDYTIY